MWQTSCFFVNALVQKKLFPLCYHSWKCPPTTHFWMCCFSLHCHLLISIHSLASRAPHYFIFGQRDVTCDFTIRISSRCLPRSVAWFSTTWALLFASDSKLLLWGSVAEASGGNFKPQQQGFMGSAFADGVWFQPSWCRLAERRIMTQRFFVMTWRSAWIILGGEKKDPEG